MSENSVLADQLEAIASSNSDLNSDERHACEKAAALVRALRPEETALLAAFDSGVHAGYMSNGESDRQRFRQQFLESLKRHEPQKREG